MKLYILKWEETIQIVPTIVPVNHVNPANIASVL